MAERFGFRVLATDGRARGEIVTPPMSGINADRRLDGPRAIVRAAPAASCA